MDTKFSFTTIDNSEMNWNTGAENNLKFLANLVFHKFDDEDDADHIYIEYSYNKFTHDDEMYEESLGSISIEEAKNLIRALQFMTEGK